MMPGRSTASSLSLLGGAGLLAVLVGSLCFAGAGEPVELTATVTGIDSSQAEALAIRVQARLRSESREGVRLVRLVLQHRPDPQLATPPQPEPVEPAASSATDSVTADDVASPRATASQRRSQRRVRPASKAAGPRGDLSRSLLDDADRLSIENAADSDEARMARSGKQRRERAAERAGEQRRVKARLHALPRSKRAVDRGRGAGPGMHRGADRGPGHGLGGSGSGRGGGGSGSGSGPGSGGGPRHR